MTIKKAVFMIGLSFLCLPALALAENVIYISQVQITGGSGHTTDDFVEFYNPNVQLFNLNGYRLVKRTASGTTDSLIKSWTSDEFIPAFGFYLWANTNFTTIAATPDATTTGSLADNNGIAIRLGPNDSGSIIDSLAWGSANNTFSNLSAENPTAGQSLQRNDLVNTSSAFTIGISNPRNSFITTSSTPASTSTEPSASELLATSTPASSTEATSTPDTASQASSAPQSILPPPPPPPPPAGSGGGIPAWSKTGAIKISEILANPDGEDSGNEQVELENTSNQTLNLDGWFLDDKPEGSGPKTSAYKLSGFIQAQQFLNIKIPKGNFALNNSGGDVVNLYYPDKTVADSVSYSANAQENLSYQKIGSSWVWSPTTLGQANVQNFQPSGQTSSANNFQISISEILPNPDGQDEGMEWVELYNAEKTAISLKNFILDDSGSSLPGSSSFTLSENLVIPAGGFLKIVIPEDKFNLNNTEDSLRLFDPAKHLIGEVAYKNAPAGQSYFKDKQAKWLWGLPTPGKENISEVILPVLWISELVANPTDGQDEFVEIFNPTENPVPLANLVLEVGNKKKIFDSESQIKAKDYLVILEDDLPARLRNSGQTVILADVLGRQITKLDYPTAKQGFAYASIDGKNYSWTESPTPGKENQFVLGETTNSQTSEKSKSQTSSTAADITKAQVKQILQNEQDLKEQVAVLQESLNQLQAKLDAPPQSLAPAQAVSAQVPVSAAMGHMIIWPSALAILGGVIYSVFRKAKK